MFCLTNPPYPNDLLSAYISQSADHASSLITYRERVYPVKERKRALGYEVVFDKRNVDNAYLQLK